MKKEGSSYAHGTTHGILPRKEPRMEDRRETKTSHEELRNEKSQKRKEEDRCKNKTGLTTKYDRVGQWSVMVEYAP